MIFKRRLFLVLKNIKIQSQIDLKIQCFQEVLTNF
jgi:hypothetical protein